MGEGGDGMKISASSNGRCVDRAVSTMRAALGYDTALPEGWDNNVENRHNHHVITLFHRAFPDREVLVWCSEESWNQSEQLLNWMGGSITSGEKWDDYLFAFAYETNKEKKKSHMVLGWPSGDENLRVGIALAVKI